MQGEQKTHDLRVALTRVVRNGADAVWLPEIQSLLELPAVQAAISGPPPREPGDALRAVLKHAAQQLGRSQYRKLLTIVLDLDREYADLSVQDRRAVAGREFRDGQRPVSAGTIRQHHERRALDQLAEVLQQQAYQDAASRGTVRARVEQSTAIQWHPSAHEAWAGERLYFFLVGFSAYDRDITVDRIRAVMEQTNVHSVSIHELFGQHDLLIRAWIPAAAYEFENALHDAFRGDPALIIDRFAVDEIVSHWLWGPLGAMREPVNLVHHLSDIELKTINNAAAREDIPDHCLDAGLVAAQPVREGIDLSIAISAGRHSASREAISHLRERIVECVQQSGLTQASLYRGMGFATFLIRGRMSTGSFFDIRRRLIMPLEDDVAVLGMRCRITTFIAATPTPALSVETIPLTSTSDEPVTAAELLEHGEGRTLEVKASAFHPIRPWLERGELVGGSSAADALRATITALLNTDGGTVIIGALSTDTANDNQRLADAPRIGNYVVSGIDHELGDGRDAFERRLRALWRTGIQPDPNAYVLPSMQDIRGRTLCVVEVHALDHSLVTSPWFYDRPSKRGAVRFWVRDGAASQELAGVELDEYRSARIGPDARTKPSLVLRS